MKTSIFILSSLLFVFYGCQSNSKKNIESTAHESSVEFSPVEWSKNSNIYEVNIRQYTPEGTFKAFENHLPRLKNMGVDILWIMPIHPVSEKNRKGTLGSYYAVQDYQKVNPNFGTLDDFKHLVNTAHEQGMKVIIDWVANHTGWDNWLIKEHSDWYTKDSLGNIIVPLNTDWSDVADLNYDNPELREYMIQSLEYWIKETNIDGYRCDVAGMVPVDFWVSARERLDAIKPVFMLAEDGSKEILKAFDMNYGWEFHHIMNHVAQGKSELTDFDSYFAKIDSIYDAQDYTMQFTSNHDENSWNGTVFERMGDAAEAMAVLSFTVPGMPLIYSGQEAKMNKRLAFFEKDEIDWSNLGYEDLYTTLIALKKDNQALWNGMYGGTFSKIENSQPANVYSFTRLKDNNIVLVVLNLSDKTQKVSLKSDNITGLYTSPFSQTSVELSNNSILSLDPWGYQVLVK